MRTIALALSALTLAWPAAAQLVGPQPPQASPPMEQQPSPDPAQPDDQLQSQDNGSGQAVTNIVVVAIEDLPAEVKAQAEAVVARTTAKELARLQNSVDASLDAVSALRTNGLNSTQVVAANIDGDGTLTLIIQTTA